jgi:hypothetical protein
MNIEQTNTFPYLFINAMKGSGKTRLLKLIAKLCNGDVLNSVTEAILFRTKNCLAIDEFEGVGRKGNEALKELLNSAYKKGIKVKRMKKVKTFAGEEQQVEEFDVYRPIVIANIWGMEDVLGDRCIKIILDKSSNPVVTKKIENFSQNPQIQKIQCRKCMKMSFFNVYTPLENAWNYYIKNKYYLHLLHTYTNNTNNTNNTELEKVVSNFLGFFNRLDESNLNGRVLELSFPLLFIADFLGEEEFNKLLKTLREIESEKKEEDVVENLDVAVLDFVSQELTTGKFITLKGIVQRFREHMQSNEEWINERWMSRALKRLNLMLSKRRTSVGVEILLDIDKALKKMEMFK